MFYETLQLHGSTLYLYCERMAEGLWQEPVNSISAIAFVLAGGTGIAFCARVAKGDWLRILMACCLLAIGVASVIVHSTGRLFPDALDITPVLLFDALATWIIFKRGFALSFVASLLAVILVVVTSALLIPISHKWSMASWIVPHLGFVLWLVLTGSVLIAKNQSNSGATLIAASVLLFIALWINSKDLFVCSEFPIGLHWAWHIVNALGAYLILRGVPRKPSKSATADPEALASLSI